MNWKHTVGEIINGMNQLIVEDSGEIPNRLFEIAQTDYERELKRMERTKQNLIERKCKPLKSESTMKLLNVINSEVEATADVLVRQSFVYEQRGNVLHQESFQYYSVSCRIINDNWVVTRWEPIDRPADYKELIYGDNETRGIVNKVTERDLFRHERGYDRTKAARYAETWWNGANPRYLHFGVDCTNFVSQCLHAGGLPMEFSSRRDRGWWYRGTGSSSDSWSYSWAVANALYWYLKGGKGTIPVKMVSTAEELTIGDVICYDFDGDGRWQHNTIVVALDRSGMPLVNAHTNDSRMRYWNYEDSYAWTEQTKYAFFHIG